MLHTTNVERPEYQKQNDLLTNNSALQILDKFLAAFQVIVIWKSGFFLSETDRECSMYDRQNRLRYSVNSSVNQKSVNALSTCNSSAAEIEKIITGLMLQCCGYLS